MKDHVYRKLKTGDEVVLADKRPEYSCGRGTPAGSKGVVRNVKVPCVTKRHGNPHSHFCTVDCDADSVELTDLRGRPTEHWHRKRPVKWRVAA